MSAPPPPPNPPRRPLHERSSSQNNRLGIRIVPYSPPRLSSDGSTSSRVVSCTDVDASSLRPSRTRQSSVESTPGSDCQTVPERDVSALRRSTGPVSPTLSPVDEQQASIGAPALPSSPMRRSKNVITVNSDKTFSLLPQSHSVSSRSDSARSPLSSLTTPRSSYGRYSSDTWVEERPSSPLTPLAEHSLSPDSSPSPAPGQSPNSTSPWNYRLVGGLRKVRKTPDPKATQSSHRTHSRSSSGASIRVPPVLLPQEQGPQPSLSNKNSFQSSLSESTNSDTANYKVLGQSSPITRSAYAVQDSSDVEQDQLPPSSSHSNYQVHHVSSSDSLSLNEPTRPPTGDSDANYLVHRGSSSSLISSISRLRPEYSQESLVVPPLRPIRRRSFEFSNLVKSRSRDSLRTGSLTSLSTAISQEATRALFAGAATIQVPPRLYRQNSRGTLSGSSSHAPQMITYPHQWSSQLSTVASESEPGSEPPSRSVSSLSAAERRSSGAPSSHGRRMLSISSALSGLEETQSQPSHSRSGSLEQPLATHQRQTPRDLYSPPMRLVRDLDEDGDGLADLEALHHRPSRTRLNGTLSNRSSDRNLRSSSSSRANSFSSVAFPAWARLYYGSGERRLIAMPSSDSMFSQFNDSRPTSTFLHKAPSLERLANNLYSPRWRPREQQPDDQTFGETSRRSMEITPNPLVSIARGLKKQTSSIWSPHLHRDKRANIYSIWEPPSADWADDNGSLGRRNIQFILFVIGFVFPFAWMIGALLPLPPNPQLKMFEEAPSTSHIDLENETSLPAQNVLEARYRRIKWWRSVNRRMSIVGFLVIGAIIALSVVGVQQQW